MGIWDALRGRTRRRPPDLDSLFQVPAAAITLQTAVGLTPTGSGSVCFRAAEGSAFAHTRDEVVSLLNADPQAPDVRLDVDEFGFTWLTVERDPADVAGVCTDLHAVNTALEGQGFAEGLLCTLVPFADAQGHRVGLVYLYGRGTFYPFAQAAARTRDPLLERRVRDAVAGELPWETDPQRWLAVWGAPGL
jgi:hypothetical protein